MKAERVGVLQHPNIVTIYGYGENDNLAFFTMEYVDGESLQSIMEKDEKISNDTILKIFSGIASGIDYAHSKSIIHRDLKPANIMITSEDKIIKIMDFGISKVMNNSLTQTGDTLGTPNYMSPEQISGRKLDSRSDIFSLGIILYELLAGKKPFIADTFLRLSHAILQEKPKSLEIEDDTLCLLLDTIIEKCLHKDPTQRYSNAREIVAALQDVLT